MIELTFRKRNGGISAPSEGRVTFLHPKSDMADVASFALRLVADAEVDADEITYRRTEESGDEQAV